MSPPAELRSPADAPAPDLDDDEADDGRPVRIVVLATATRPPVTEGPRSVFELGACRLKAAQLTKGLTHPAPANAPRFVQAVHGAAGIVCRGGQYPADRWTPERQAREIARRAKQRPPRPTRKAKTRSRKLRDLIGDVYDD